MTYIVLIMISMTILGISVGIGIGYHIAERKYFEMMREDNRKFQQILDEQVTLAKRGLI